MRTFTLIFTGMVIPCLIFAQQRLLTMEEASMGSQKLTAKTLAQFQWNGETDSYFFVAKNALVKGTVSSSARDTIIKLSILNEKLKKISEDTLTRFPAISIFKTDNFSFTQKNKLFTYSLGEGILSKVNSWPDKAENTDQEKNTFLTAYTTGNNLYLSENGEEFVVEKSSNPDISYGSSRVHRNEFGISKIRFGYDQYPGLIQ